MTGRFPRPPLLDRVRPGTTVIQASAGTGKTWTLERLVVELLLRHGLTLDQVLVVTYTEKAAGEMREGIRDLLQTLARGDYEPAPEAEPGWVIGPAEALRLEAALAGFDRAVIATIHGFCLRVLQETAFLSGRPFEADLAPGEDLYQRAFQACLRERWAADPARGDALRLALEQLGSEQAFLDLLHTADQEARKGALDLGGPEPDLDPAAVAALPLAGEERIQEALRALGVPRPKDLARRLETFRSVCAAAAAPGQAWRVAVAGCPQAPTAKQLESLEAARDGAGAGGDLVRAYLAGLELSRGWVARVVRAFLPDLQAALAGLKEREALLDFDDMVRQVAGALRDPEAGPALAERLRQRFRAVLVDEFQDTDPGQWEIFRSAFQAAGTFLVLIGDPKQAIYAFRGGDVETYLAAVATAEGPDRVVTLDRNFRSTPRMIAAYNRILGDGEAPGAGLFTGEIQYGAPVRPGDPDKDWRDAAGAPLAPVQLVPVPLAQGEATIAEVQRRTAAALAGEIAALLAAGTVFRGPAPEPLAPQDVFVLVRRAADGLLAADALRRAGVPVAFYKQEGLGRSREARDVLDLLGALLAPGDRSACARAWLTPFFGLGFDDLEGARDLPDDHPLRARLLAWSRLAAAGAYPDLYRSLADESGLVPRLLRAPEPGARRSLGIYLQLLDHLLEQGAGRRLPFHALVAELAGFVERGVQPPGEDTDLHRVETDRGAVQILTMHKSKGLEAKVVALLGGLSDSARRRGPYRLCRRHERRQRISWLGAEAPADLEASHAREEREEEERLLYVALTRAKARLLLPLYRAPEGAPLSGRGSFEPDGNPKGSYGILNRRLRDLEAAGRLPEDLFTDLPVPAAPAPAGADTEPPAPPALPALPELEAAARAARPRRVLSFTAIARALRDEDDADPESWAPRGPRAPGLPGGAGTGSCLHRILELVPVEGLAKAGDLAEWLARPEIRTLLERALDEHGLDRRWTGEAGRLVHRAWLGPLALPDGTPLPALARAEPILRETAFTFLQDPAGDFLEGSIDLLFRWRGRTCFLDWKSNLLEDYRPETCARAVAEHYDLQARIYTLAALKFLGVRDRDAYEERFGGGLYLFLRGFAAGQGVHAFRPDWDEVRAWGRELAEAGREVAHGRR